MYNPVEYHDDMIQFVQDEYGITLENWQRELIVAMTKDFAKLTYQCYKEPEMKKKRFEKEEMNHTHTLSTICTSEPVEKFISSYGSLGTIGVSPEMYGVKQQEGNNPMNYATATVQAATTETQDQRKYLSQRLENIFYSLREPLYAKFGLSDDMPPRTPKELKKRIEDGKFIIKGIKEGADLDDDEDEFYYGSWAGMIRWRDPSVKADSEGYEAATKELGDLRQKTLDIIKIEDPKAGLEAIKAFEAWEPTGAAN